MERKIIVIDAATSKRVVLNTDVKTRGELSTLVRNAGVNVEGKDWMESLTKTTLTDDASLLPVEAEYKGEKTNNLVFVLSDSNKKIELGADRKVLYTTIKEMNLENTVKEITGRNFTQVTNNTLQGIIDAANADKEKASKGFSSVDHMCLQDKYTSLCFAVASLLASIDESVLADVNNAVDRIMSDNNSYEITDSDIDDILS